MHSFEVHSNESACRNLDVLGWTKSIGNIAVVRKQAKSSRNDRVYSKLVFKTKEPYRVQYKDALRS